MRNLKQYSKKIVHAMIVLWFIGAVFGGAVVVAELIAQFFGDGYGSMTTVYLPELLNYIGLPVGGCIVGYLVKSAFENVKKIEKNSGLDYEDHI